MSKLWKKKVKDKILKAVRDNRHTTYVETSLRITTIILSENIGKTPLSTYD